MLVPFNPPVTSKIVEAEVDTGACHVAVVREVYSQPIMLTARRGRLHHLQLSFLPLPSAPKSRFADRWAARRFEPMGELFMVPAQIPMDVISTCREQRSVVCQFDPAATEEWFGEDFEWTNERLIRGLDLGSPELRGLLQRLANELLRPGHASRSMVAALSTQAFVHVSRLLLEVKQRDLGGLAPWRLRLIEEALGQDPGRVQVATLAQRCGLSARQLSRGYRNSRGETLASHIVEARFKRACALLEAGASVKEAAYAAGFGSAGNFATAFRHAVGCTPTEFKARAAL